MMNKIIVYEHEDFSGLEKEFTSDVPDLHSVNFGDCISSLKVIGQPWIAFRDLDYKGTPAVFEEGEHNQLSLNNHISSLQLVTEDLENPQITLYEHTKYEGASKKITEETNLTYGFFNNKASSHIVQKGAWLLYENPNRRGLFCVAREGTHSPNYESPSNFNDKCSHVYPLKGGQPSITSKILWDLRKVENEREVVLDEFIGVNNTDLEQTFTNSRGYEVATSHSFRFTVPNSQIDEKFNLNIDLNTTLTVEKGKPESTVAVDKMEVSVPVRIPPHSELTVQVINKVVTASAPVELYITRNKKTKTKIGEYRSMSSCHIGTKYTVKPIPVGKKT